MSSLLRIYTFCLIGFASNRASVAKTVCQETAVEASAADACADGSGTHVGLLQLHARSLMHSAESQHHSPHMHHHAQQHQHHHSQQHHHHQHPQQMQQGKQSLQVLEKPGDKTTTLSCSDYVVELSDSNYDAGADVTVFNYLVSCKSGVKDISHWDLSKEAWNEEVQQCFTVDGGKSSSDSWVVGKDGKHTWPDSSDLIWAIKSDKGLSCPGSRTYTVALEGRMEKCSGTYAVKAGTGFAFCDITLPCCNEKPMTSPGAPDAGDKDGEEEPDDESSGGKDKKKKGDEDDEDDEDDESSGGKGKKKKGDEDDEDDESSGGKDKDEDEKDNPGKGKGPKGDDEDDKDKKEKDKAPKQQGPVAVARPSTKKCPTECQAPSCEDGDFEDGGWLLDNGVCTVTCSEPKKGGKRQCGRGASFESSKDSIDCSPCMNPERECGQCVLWGDPHIVPFDREVLLKSGRGSNVDMYNYGDYWIVKSQRIYIQGRYWSSKYRGNSMMRGLAISGPFLRGSVLMIEPTTDGAVTWDGTEILEKFPSSFEVPGLLYIKYHNEAEVVRTGGKHNSIKGLDIMLPLGVTLTVNRHSGHLDAIISMHNIPGGIDGHCGNCNGDPNDDSTQAIEERFGSPVDPSEDLFETKEYSYLGCYKEDASDRDLPVRQEGLNMNDEECAMACVDYKWFGIQGNGECYCGNAYGKHGEATGCKCPPEHTGFVGTDMQCIYAFFDAEQPPVQTIDDCEPELQATAKKLCDASFKSEEVNDEEMHALCMADVCFGSEDFADEDAWAAHEVLSCASVADVQRVCGLDEVDCAEGGKNCDASKCNAYKKLEWFDKQIRLLLDGQALGTGALNNVVEFENREGICITGKDTLEVCGSNQCMRKMVRTTTTTTTTTTTKAIAPPETTTVQPTTPPPPPPQPTEAPTPTTVEPEPETPAPEPKPKPGPNKPKPGPTTPAPEPETPAPEPKPKPGPNKPEPEPKPKPGPNKPGPTTPEPEAPEPKPKPGPNKPEPEPKPKPGPNKPGPTTPEPEAPEPKPKPGPNKPKPVPTTPEPETPTLKPKPGPKGKKKPEPTTMTTTQCVGKDCTFWGDPHVHSFDKMDFSYMRAGDMWLVKNRHVWIQGRFNLGQNNTHSFLKSVAIGGPFLQGNTLTIGSGEGEILWNNGEILDRMNTHFETSFYLPKSRAKQHVRAALRDTEANIMHPEVTHRGLDVSLPHGIKLVVDRYQQWLGLSIQQSHAFKEGQDGICGNYNDVTEDDALTALHSRMKLEVADQDTLFHMKFNTWAANHHDD